jgi:hypothetical protein
MGKIRYRCKTEEKSYRPLVVTPEKNNTLQRLRYWWDTNIKRDVKDIKLEGVNRDHVT